MNFFFDRNMPPQLAKMIAAYDIKNIITHHNDDPRFNETTTDIEWISVLGGDSSPWNILTLDAAILRNKAERSALRESNLTFFCFKHGWLNLTIHEKAWRLVKIWPLLVNSVDRAIPTVFDVPVSATRIDKISATKGL